MRKLLIIAAAAGLPLLATTVLVARGGTGTDDPSSARTDRAAAQPSDSPGTSTTSTTTRSGSPSAAPIDRGQVEPWTSNETDDPAEARFICPDGGLDEVTDLQHAVDEGHQPWRLSAPDVAAACTFGIAGTFVEPAGSNRYRVTQLDTGQSAIVDVAQPLGAGGIWVVTAATPSAPTAGQAPCTTDALLPPTRRALQQDTTVRIVTVTVEQCQNGYARVLAVPDNSRCGQPNGACYDNEQVFLTATSGGWGYLTSGSGISCATDDDLGSVLTTACQRLGLR